MLLKFIHKAYHKLFHQIWFTFTPFSQISFCANISKEFECKALIKCSRTVFLSPLLDYELVSVSATISTSISPPPFSYFVFISRSLHFNIKESFIRARLVCAEALPVIFLQSALIHHMANMWPLQPYIISVQREREQEEEKGVVA